MCICIIRRSVHVSLSSIETLYSTNVRMGCCLAQCVAPMDSCPEDPSVEVYAPVSQLYVGRYTYSSGLAYVERDIFRYCDTWGREIFNVNVKYIECVSVQHDYWGDGGYIKPCSCCPLSGCPDGVLDIRGTIITDQEMMGIEFHFGLAMPDPEDFMEKLNAEINRHRMPI